MYGSDLQQQLQTLQDKYRVVMEQIALHRLDLKERMEELACLDAEVQQERSERLSAYKAGLKELRSIPPACNGWDDHRRLALMDVRPLTDTELMILSMKRSWLKLLLAVLSRPASIMYSSDVRQLRIQARQEWLHEQHILERKIEQLAQDMLYGRETSEQRSLKMEIAQLQRDLSRLKVQAQFMLIDIQALQERIALMPIP
jgi:DNA repair exonuclease SbcCD ATPase subunit